jgi:histidinol-phosphate aminotransferase
MGNSIDRRQWLKTSAMALAGLMTGPNLGACQKEAVSRQKPLKVDAPLLLNNNESPYGISPHAIEAISGSTGRSHRYPHRSYPQLTELIAERENMPADHIILGAGSTDVMVTLIHLVKEEGEILTADPTYFDFIYYANTVERALNQVGLNARFEHDLEEMENQITSLTDLIYICNPNNPTGSITPKHRLKSFCEQMSKEALVVVDEAYHEYVEDRAYASMVDLVRQGKNVIVTRTFSKIHGMAGLRIGYGMAPPEIIAKLDKLSRNFAPVAWLSLQAAIASYRDSGFVQSVRDRNKQVKSALYKGLEKLGLFYIPSHTNFVLFQVNQDAKKLVKKMEERGIFARAFGFNDKQWVRVSCGTMEEMQAFIFSLEKSI